MGGYNPELVEYETEIEEHKTIMKGIKKMTNKKLLDNYLNVHHTKRYEKIIFKEMVLRSFRKLI